MSLSAIPRSNVGIQTERPNGINPRQEIADVPIPAIQAQARSVACIIDSRFLIESSAGFTLSPHTPTLQQRANLEDGQLFGSQLAPGKGTAFLASKTAAFTAGHCVLTGGGNPVDLTTLRLVFNFVAANVGSPAIPIEKTNVFGIKRIVFAEYIYTGKKESKRRDWALVELDRKADGISPLRIDFTTKMPATADIYMLGHPAGLPMKYAVGTHVRSATPFLSSTDLVSYAGNSGGPWLNATSGFVCGIHVTGPRPEYRRMASGRFTTCESTDPSGAQPMIQLKNAHRYLQAVGEIKGLSQKDLAKVQYKVAHWLYNTKFPDSEKVAFSFYKKAAQNGHAHAALEAGRIHSSKGQERRAYRYYLSAAEAKCKIAQCKVAKRLHSGIGVEKNNAEAVNWLKKSGSRDNIKALKLLSTIYEKGRWGKDTDASKAASFAKRVAELKSGHQKPTPKPSPDSTLYHNFKEWLSSCC